MFFHLKAQFPQSANSLFWKRDRQTPSKMRPKKLWVASILRKFAP